jgi:hypothetical protein
LPCLVAHKKETTHHSAAPDRHHSAARHGEKMELRNRNLLPPGSNLAKKKHGQGLGGALWINFIWTRLSRYFSTDVHWIGVNVAFARNDRHNPLLTST